MALTAYTPVTKFYVLKNIPLDNSYTDTLTWSSTAAQASWFASQAKYRWENLGHLSATGMVRLPINIDSLYDCNYVMWQNSNFSSRWFYGFIRGMRLVNIHMTEMDIELDVMQTWDRDYTLGQCWIERQHVNDDVAGAHIEAEDFDLGEYVCNSEEREDFALPAPSMTTEQLLDTWRIVVASTENFGGNDDNMAGAMRAYIFNGLTYYSFVSAATASTFLSQAVEQGKTDAIVDVYMCPAQFIKVPKDSSEAKWFYKFTHEIPKQTKNLNGYVPKNGKMFTYPYCFLNVSNGQGNQHVYRQELFTKSSSMMEFRIASGMLPNSEILCTPRDYKGFDLCFNEQLTINGFPTCSWVSDYYKAWLAQTKSSQAANLLAIAVGGLSNLSNISKEAGGLTAGGAADVAGGAITNVARLAAQHAQAKIQPDQTHGNASGSTMFSDGDFTFFYQSMSVNYNTAKKIDDFFSMYGYRINDFGKPNYTGRKEWNYVKTGQCNATGSIPFNDLTKIKSIYNQGVTFWHNPAHVGNYTLDNGIA